MKINSDKYLQELETRWSKNRICPICGNNSWQINDTVFELPEFQGGDIVIGSGKLFPVVPIMCPNCGYTFFLNAIISGAIKPQDKQEGKENADQNKE